MFESMNQSDAPLYPARELRCFSVPLLRALCCLDAWGRRPALTINIPWQGWELHFQPCQAIINSCLYSIGGILYQHLK